MMGIYTITNLLTGKVYVGSAVDIDKRESKHFRALRRCSHHSAHLQAAWAKYGEGAFVFEVVEIVDDPFWLLAREQAWINRKCSADRRHGYNMNPTAGSPLGTTASVERRQKMSDTQKARCELPEVRRALSEASKARWASPGAGRRMSDALKARLASPAARKVISDALRGRPASSETRQKLSEATRIQMASPEARKRISDAAKARSESPEYIKKLSDAAKARSASPEYLAKLSVAAKLREAKKREAKNAV